MEEVKAVRCLIDEQRGFELVGGRWASEACQL